MSDLIGVDRENVDNEHLPHQPQNASVQPGRLAFAKGIVKIKAAFHSLKNREALEIADRYAVLENQSGMIGAQRKAVLCRHSYYKSFGATSQVGPLHAPRVSESETMQLAVAHGRSLPRHLQNLFTREPRQFFNRDWRRVQFGGERNLSTRNQRPLMEEHFPPGQFHFGACGANAELPAHMYLQRVVRFSPFFLRNLERLESLDQPDNFIRAALRGAQIITISHVRFDHGFFLQERQKARQLRAESFF